MPERISPKIAQSAMLKKKLKPLEPYRNALSKWKCECLKCGDIVYPKYNSIQQGRGGCRRCGLKERKITNKLEESKAIELMLKSGLEPLDKYVSSHTPWKSRCLKCNKITYPRLSGIRNGRQGGCKACGYQKAAAKNRFSQEEAKEQLIEFGYQPLEKYKSSHAKWKSRCSKCQNIVYPKLAMLRSGQGGCVYCSSRQIDIVKVQNLLKKSKLKALEEKPENLKLGWKCKCLRCHRNIKVYITNLYRGSDPCKYCSGKAVDPKSAISKMKSANLRVLEPYKSSGARWKSECMKCKHVVYPKYNSIQNGQGGCMYCAEKGMDMSSPSYLYLIINAELGALKIGIGNDLKNPRSDRLKTHMRHGWETLKLWHFDTGARAYEIEQDILIYLRKTLGVPPYLSKEQMPQRGETETMEIERINLFHLQEFIEDLIRLSKKTIDRN